MLGLPVLTAPIALESGRMILDGRAIPDAALWAFEAIPDETSEVIETPFAFYVFRLDSVRPEGAPPFDEVEEEVRRAAMAAKKWTIARELAAEIDTRIRAGQSLAEVALEFLLTFTTLGPMNPV